MIKYCMEEIRIIKQHANGLFVSQLHAAEQMEIQRFLSAQGLDNSDLERAMNSRVSDVLGDVEL